MTRRCVSLSSVVVFFTMLPGASQAEVIDKIPTLTELWVDAVLCGVLGFFAWRRHVVLGIAAVTVSTMVWGFHAELSDPFLGPQIIIEAGHEYVAQAYGALFLCAAFHLSGVATLLWRRSQSGWFQPSGTASR